MDNLKESTHFRAQHYICNHCEFNSQTRSTGHKIEGILHALLFRESEKYYKQIANQVRDGIEMYHYNSYPHNVIASFISLLFLMFVLLKQAVTQAMVQKKINM